jgi:ribose transport system ATP-binding protein
VAGDAPKSNHPASGALLSARGLSKTFGNRTVLRNFALDIAPGEIHGLLGQNGSGKSTVVKILAGYHAPDPGGSLTLRGEPVPLPIRPNDPRRLGLSFVHQDLGMIETASVLENVRIGRYRTGVAWHVSWRSERAVVRDSLRRFGLALDPDELVGPLPAVEQALLAIVRALDEVQHVDSGILVLDEPTAYLPRDGVERLFAAVRDVASSGFGVVFVSHRLEEVRNLTDHVSILRDGQLVEQATTESLTESALIERILGFELEELYPVPHETEAERALSIRNLSGGSIRDFSLDVKKGEVIGITGLLGMGYEELPYLLFGATRATSGTVELAGRTHELSSLTPYKALGLGLALLPGNRAREGGVAAASTGENVSLTSLPAFFKRGLLRLGRMTRWAEELLQRYAVRPPEPGQPFGTLSGGNQQKALVGKWFATTPTAFILHEPTQGVDVGARRQIFERISDAARGGTAFILASAEYDDLAHLCDRVLVIRDGRVISELHGASLTPARIMEQCFRVDVGGATIDA